MAQKFFAQKIEEKQKCLSRWTLHFLFYKFFCISKHKNVASQKQWFLTIFANFEVFCHKTALKLFAQKIHFYQNYSLRLKSHFLFDKLFHSCDCFWMATDGKRHKKQSKFDKNRDFDPLGVEIELWAMNPKRCARSTYGGTWCRQILKIPNRFPKNCIWRFFHLVMRKKCANIFCTKKFLSQEKLL